jgi:hypothetical protein
LLRYSWPFQDLLPSCQLTLMPVLAQILGEEMLLILGLLGGCAHVRVQDHYLTLHQQTSVILNG